MYLSIGSLLNEGEGGVYCRLGMAFHKYQYLQTARKKYCCFVDRFVTVIVRTVKEVLLLDRSDECKG